LYGAAPTTAVTPVVIHEKKDGKVVDWMEKVTDDQYQAHSGQNEDVGYAVG
jgi:hypothetical protein